MEANKQVATTEVAKKNNKKRYYNKKKVTKPVETVKEIKTEIKKEEGKIKLWFNQLVQYFKNVYNKVISYFKK